jgi:UTP--glucose-1-phosphate uridylyltransferase
VEEAVQSGLTRILIIDGKDKDAISDYFKNNSKAFGFPPIHFVTQQEPLGLADAIRYAERFTEGKSFVIKLGDTIYTTRAKIPVTAQLVRIHSMLRGAPIIAVEKVPEAKIPDYGIVSGRKAGRRLWKLDGMVEKPKPENAPSDLGITGTYVVTPGIYEAIGKIKPGVNGELQLTDALRHMLRKGSPMYGYKFNGNRYDIGTPVLWKRTDLLFSRRDPALAPAYRRHVA